MTVLLFIAYEQRRVKSIETRQLADGRLRQAIETATRRVGGGGAGRCTVTCPVMATTCEIAP